MDNTQKIFYYQICNQLSTVRKLRDDLLYHDQISLGHVATMDHQHYFSNADHKPVLFHMEGSFSLINEPLNYHKITPDMTTFYYDNLLWRPSNNARMHYLMVLNEFLSDYTCTDNNKVIDDISILSNYGLISCSDPPDYQ